jgi:tRNA modification GTPase
MSMLPATASRCRESLKRCGDSLQAAIAMTEQRHMQEELVAAEIRLAMEELGWIAGEVYTDDLLDRIFSQFCIGK